MKKIRNIVTLILTLALILCLPLSVQAEETEFREIYLEGAYRVNDQQIVFDFTEPIKINYGIRTPWLDIRMTNTSGSIVGIYDKAGNRTAYYQWTTVEYEYLDSEHDKIIITIKSEWFGCDGISDLYSGNNTFPDDVKEKIEKGTYRFYVGFEEKYPAGNKELKNDGQLKNLMSENEPDVYVWPTKLSGTECVHYWLDELESLPADIKVDKTKFEPMTGNSQSWDHDIITFEDVPQGGYAELMPMTTTVVKNNPLVVAGLIGGAVILPTILSIALALIIKKRKAA